MQGSDTAYESDKDQQVGEQAEEVINDKDSQADPQIDAEKQAEKVNDDKDSQADPQIDTGKPTEEVIDHGNLSDDSVFEDTSIYMKGKAYMSLQVMGDKDTPIDVDDDDVVYELITSKTTVNVKTQQEKQNVWHEMKRRSKENKDGCVSASEEIGHNPFDDEEDDSTDQEDTQPRMPQAPPPVKQARAGDQEEEAGTAGENAGATEEEEEAGAAGENAGAAEEEAENQDEPAAVGEKRAGNKQDKNKRKKMKAYFTAKRSGSARVNVTIEDLMQAITTQPLVPNENTYTGKIARKAVNFKSQSAINAQDVYHDYTLERDNLSILGKVYKKKDTKLTNAIAAEFKGSFEWDGMAGEIAKAFVNLNSSDSWTDASKTSFVTNAMKSENAGMLLIIPMTLRASLEFESKHMRVRIWQNHDPENPSVIINDATLIHPGEKNKYNTHCLDVLVYKQGDEIKVEKLEIVK